MSKQLKGVLGTKLGMTQVFSDDGKVVPVTVVAAGPCVVTPGRTPDSDGYHGLKMAGRMGNARTTAARLSVHGVDTERGLLLIRGAVPGPSGGLVLVRTAAKQFVAKEAK